jgi:hypothetical protein
MLPSITYIATASDINSVVLLVWGNDVDLLLLPLSITHTYIRASKYSWSLADKKQLQPDGDDDDDHHTCRYIASPISTRIHVHVHWAVGNDGWEG